MYRDTHSVLLFLIVSTVSIYLLYKLYSHARQWAAVWSHKRQAITAPAYVPHAVESGDNENTVNINKLSRQLTGDGCHSIST
jgi:hypothetical protein